MVDMTAENAFTRMLLGLEKRIDALQERVLEGKDAPRHLMKDAEGYESGIKRAEQHAAQHNISLRLYYEQFLRIDGKLRSIKDTINKRINSRPYQMTQSYVQGYDRGIRLFRQETRYGRYNNVSYQLPQEQLPWWRKALGFVVGAISVVANILSSISVFTPLPILIPLKLLK
jgi:hypothetical protein